MMRCKRWQTHWFAGCCLVLALLTAAPAFAGWRYMMLENFEGQAANWVWSQPATGSYSRPWRVVPFPQYTNPHWGIQDYIYRVDVGYPERYIQAAWCDASNGTNSGGGFDPEFNRYRNNMHTHMRWGPIRTDTVANARCTFEWVNETAPGDTFFWEAAWSFSSTPPDPLQNRDRWFPAVKLFTIRDSLGVALRDTLLKGFHCGRAITYWQYSTIKLDSLDSAGTVISLIENRMCGSDGDLSPMQLKILLRGAFVDNVKVSYDDGKFDISASTCSAVTRDSINSISIPQVGDTVLFKLIYRVSGNAVLRDTSGVPVPVRFECRINNMLFWETTTTIDAGDGDSTYTIYTAPYGFPIEGTYDIQWSCDADSVVLESSEMNNSCSTQLGVVRPNYPPFGSFILVNEHTVPTSPAPYDTISIRRRPLTDYYIDILVYTGDVDDSTANWTIQACYDSTGAGAWTLQTNPAFPRIVHGLGGIDTVRWNVGRFDNGIWYLLLSMDDFVNPSQTVICKTIVAIDEVSVLENPTVALPTVTRIENSYPNPFNSDVQIRVGLAKATHAVVTVHDIMGREVERLPLSDQKPGWYTINWHPRNLASGVYFARLQTDHGTVSMVKLNFVK